MTGGYFADRFSKRSVTIGTKIFDQLNRIFRIACRFGHFLALSITNHAMDKYGAEGNVLLRRRFAQPRSPQASEA